MFQKVNLELGIFDEQARVLQLLQELVQALLIRDRLRVEVQVSGAGCRVAGWRRGGEVDAREER